jgi:hypothetical protein
MIDRPHLQKPANPLNVPFVPFLVMRSVLEMFIFAKVQLLKTFVRLNAEK